MRSVRSPGSSALVAALLASGAAFAGVPGTVVVFADGFETLCSADADLDIAMVEVSATVTLNGEAPPASGFEDGRLSLRNTATGDALDLGLSSAPGASLQARVIPGRYEAFWSLDSGGAQVPSNSAARLGAFDIDGSTPLAIDVPMVTVAGSFSLDGGPMPASPMESARISLRAPDSGDEVLLGETADGSYLRNIVPGRYEVVYALSEGGLVIPLNGERVVATVDIPDDPEIVHTLDIALESGLVSGDIRFNGAVPPATTADAGSIRFRDPVTGDETPVGNSANGAYSARLLAGDYAVYYTLQASGGVAPVNTHARLVESYAVTPGAQTLDIDVPVVDLTATVTLNGQAPPASSFEDGAIHLRNPDTGDEALIGLSSEPGGVLAARVVAGTYEAFWALDSGGAQVPANARAALGSYDIAADPMLAIDVPAVSFAGDFVLDGAAPPASALESARIWLREPRSGDEVLLGSTHDGSFLRYLVPGRYRIEYELEQGGTQVPRNPHHVVGEIEVPVVSSEVVFQQDIELHSATVAGAITLNGAAPPASAFETGRILFHDRVTGAGTHVGNTHDAAYAAKLLAGSYDVLYSLDAGGAQVPQNTRAVVGEHGICPAD